MNLNCLWAYPLLFFCCQPYLIRLNVLIMVHIDHRYFRKLFKKKLLILMAIFVLFNLIPGWLLLLLEVTKPTLLSLFDVFFGIKQTNLVLFYVEIQDIITIKRHRLARNQRLLCHHLIFISNLQTKLLSQRAICYIGRQIWASTTIESVYLGVASESVLISKSLFFLLL